jgi:SET domain-containing protein
MNDPFISKVLYLKNIPEIGGWGVFVNEDIPANTVLEVSPVFLYPKNLLDIAIYMSAAEGIPESKIGLDQYAIVWNESSDSYNKASVMLGYLSIYNHSNNNNSTYFTDYTDRLVGVVTLRDLKKDEQVTVSYGEGWFEKKKKYLKYVEF